jgi:hypothetical protein
VSRDKMTSKVYHKKSTAKEIANDFSATLKGKTAVLTGGNIGSTIYYNLFYYFYNNLSPK